VSELGAKPSAAYEQGSSPDEMQLASAWDEIAQYSPRFGSSPEYAGIHLYIWSRRSASGAVFVDDGSDPDEPSVFVTSSTDSYWRLREPTRGRRVRSTAECARAGDQYPASPLTPRTVPFRVRVSVPSPVNSALLGSGRGVAPPKRER
jgi:hypothetical protein